jgi:hypothetical protein
MSQSLSTMSLQFLSPFATDSGQRSTDSEDSDSHFDDAISTHTGTDSSFLTLDQQPPVAAMIEHYCGGGGGGASYSYSNYTTTIHNNKDESSLKKPNKDESSLKKPTKGLSKGEEGKEGGGLTEDTRDLMYWGRKLLARIPQQRWRRQYRHPRTDTRWGGFLLRLKLYRLEIIGTVMIVAGVAIVIASVVNPDAFTFRDQQESSSSSNSSLRPPTTTMNTGGGSGWIVTWERPSLAPALSPTGMYDGFVYVGAPTVVPLDDTQNDKTSNAPHQTPAPPPSYTEPPTHPKSQDVMDILSLISPQGQLEDPTTPQGMAYQWLVNMDELHLARQQDDTFTSSRIQRIQQRYILATLYFATGGRRTTTTWSVCGAVPMMSSSTSTSSSSSSSRSTRCIYEDGISVCADRDAFIYCNASHSQSQQQQQLQQQQQSQQGLPPPEAATPPQEEAQEQATDMELDDFDATDARPSSTALAISSSFRQIDTSTNVIMEDATTTTSSTSSTSKRWLSEVSECLWFGVTCTSNETLESIVMVGNGLMGSLVPEFAFLSDLTLLDLSHNQLEGTLPTEWGAPFSQLSHLSLAHNAFQGSLPPAWFYALSNLDTFNVQSNQLTGILPPMELALWSRNMKHLFLSGNRFKGAIPESIGQLSRLQWLDASGNDWTGSLPSSLSSLQQLKYLNVSDCVGLEGSRLPDEIGSLTSLGKSRATLGCLARFVALTRVSHTVFHSLCVIYCVFF